MVLTKPGLWINTNIVAIRLCNKNNTVAPPRECTRQDQPAEILVVQLPSDMWKDRRRSGLLAVRDWQAIPKNFFGKRRAVARLPKAKRTHKKYGVPLVTVSSQDSTKSLRLIKKHQK